MNSYWSDDSYEDGEHLRDARIAKGHDKEETFIPPPGSKISQYKMKTCKMMEQNKSCNKGHKCIYAHNKYQIREDPQEPIPLWVKDIYNEMKINRKKNKADFDVQSTATGDRRNLIFNDNDDYSPNFIQPRIPLNSGSQHSIPQFDTHSVGIPIVSGSSFQQNDGIEDAYKKLKIENLDLQAIVTKLQRDNQNLTSELEGSMKNCQNCKSMTKKYKEFAVSDNSELLESLKKQQAKDRATIEELKSMVNELEVENSKLTQKNKELSKSGSLANKSTDVYYDIATHAIGALEEISKSVLSKKLMKNPVLTPSLAIVDKVDVYAYLDKHPKHPFNKMTKPIKGKIFIPMKKVIDLRCELKSMIEEQEEINTAIKISLSDADNNSNDLAKKISGLESKLKDRQEEIKGLNKKKNSLENELKNSKANITKLQQEIASLKKGSNKSQKNKDEAAIKGYKKQIAELNDKIKLHLNDQTMKNKEISQLKNEISQEKAQATQFKEMASKYQSQAAQQKNQVPKLTQEISKLKKQISQLEEEAEFSTKQAKKLEDKNKNQKKAIGSFNQKITELNKNVDEAEVKKSYAEATTKKVEQEKEEMEQELTQKIKSLDKDLLRRNKIIVSQKKQMDSLSDVKKLQEDNGVLKDTITQICDSMETMLECNETNVPMKNPCVTPSGHTVEKEVLEQWIFNGEKDPWNGAMCKSTRKNLLASELALLLEQYKGVSSLDPQ
ncbi:unnamed protein product [Moneuplotes crassus]|uniref:C3H1-type domain-containing protein n=1 Tax=Euplotes crassus TaxID=5936 RepID=A0AAD1Y9X3_EUPCR|nr:unnamed protein product [Moneuplotes crassus]